jgi:hypothetical protein
MKKFVAAFALAVAAGVVSAPAQAVVIGTNSVESSMPFGSSVGG